ncbi:sodium:proton antiporter [Brooklawnia cerclae]|uniref:Na+/H+ antiporter NhaD/arsenite permease-like protein n=1 Tax=Brooklawnia cerclae TaxID=349934 RepID=A0ABX0SIA5_9ACTN|nr:sodium:proton antiporter [Brooklawnia cerclae]NIH58074.1 Na+/H+ antiporter NhaD/arsenite permease-like protein [Brooklawnia cerclae]
MDAVVPWWGIIPFVVMLLSIALMPLIPATAHKWEDWRFQFGLALVLGIPVAVWIGLLLGWMRVGDAVWEYVQFILLLFALFVVSGGLFLAGDIRATPRNNTIVLAIGAVVASFVGTTGAAMLLIRPLLNINKERRNKVHTVVFTILIVANNGGLLTPLGDPPLFMGFLRGVPFTWTFHLFPMWLFINAMLLIIYFALDTKAYSQEEIADRVLDATQIEPVRVKGLVNFLWFAVIILAVAFIPSMDLEAIEEGHAVWSDYIPFREIVFLAAAAGSLITGSKKIRYELNQFSWGPIREVAVIFVGIFLTMIPALEYLGQAAHRMPLNTITFFAFTGALSSFLDNAPTYATFFEMAHSLGADPGIMALETRIAGVPQIWLEALSLGSVTCGAMTYIGNGPNFMVKSVAESRGIQMPSFGGYIGWTVRYLLPTLVSMVCIFLAHSVWALVVGIVIALVLIGMSARTWLTHRVPTPKVITTAGPGEPDE